VGDTIYLYLNTYTLANNIPLIVTIASPSGAHINITMNFSGSDYGPTPDTGPIYNQRVQTGTSGSTEPTWATTIGSYTTDSSILWKEVGPEVIDWQPIGPTTAPTVVNIPNPGLSDNWAANTYFNPALAIVDSNNNLQTLTTAGTTASSVPTW